MINKFTVEQKDLLSLLTAMQPICTKRTTIDTTSSILFQVGYKELILKATDLEISLQASCLLHDSDILEHQTFLVSGKRIFDIVKELDGTITFTYENNQLLLQSESVSLCLNTKDAQTFPPFPEKIENLMQLDPNHILFLLDKVAFLIPQNNANSALNGLFFELDKTGLTMTTTDGHCLAQVHTKKYALEEEKKWLLPRRAVLEIKKIIENMKNQPAFLGMCGNQLVFSGQTYNFFTKLLADQFPQYTTILKQDGFIPATVDRGQLIKTLRRTACLLSGQFLSAQFGFNKDQLNVQLVNKEVGHLKEILPLQEFEGKQLDMRFYTPYLLNGLQVLSDETIKFYLKNESKPIIFESSQDDYQIKYLVMPVSPSNT